jgi:hypothetical protein
MPRVRGSALLTRVSFVKERYGEEGWKRLHARLAPETQKVLAGRVESRSWHSFDAFVDLNVRADVLFGKGDNRLCYEMGAYGADRNMNTIYKVFFQRGTVSFMMGKAAALWSEHYDSGKLISKTDAKNTHSLSIVDFAQPACAHCFSVMGWAARCIELTGASLAEQQRTACRHWRGDAACVLSFRTK